MIDDASEHAPLVADREGSGPKIDKVLAFVCLDGDA